MSSKEQKHSESKAGTKQRSPKPAVHNLETTAKQPIQPNVVEGVDLDPGSLTTSHVLQLQRSIGNQAVGNFLTKTEARRQPKLPVVPAFSASIAQRQEHDKQVIQRAPTYEGFKSAAKTINTRLSTTKSSLTPILNLLQLNEGHWDFQSLAQLETAITTLKDNQAEKYTKYATALTALKQEIVAERHVIATTGIALGDELYVVKTGGNWNVYNCRTDKLVVQMLNEAEKNYLVGVTNYMAEKEGTTGVAIRGREGLIEGMVKNRAQMASGDFKKGPWQDALNTLESTVIKRVNEDRHLLIADHLITKEHKLSSVKFTGSDFHKGGQQVIFLYFTKEGGRDERKVVYKPSSLWLDALLFGKDSVASMLDPDGNVISQYEIISVADETNKDLGYGYMEFVESGLPTSAMDLLGVYRSIAGSMAMSYLAGLDDLHKENVLLLKNKIQVIDMEATTGVFDKGRQVGFIGQQWNASIAMIRDKLFEQVLAGYLRDAPKTPLVRDAMKTEFADMLDRAASKDIDAKWNENKRELAGAKSRIVPIATEQFYGFINLVKDHKLDTYEKWKAHVNGDVGGILEVARGLTTNSTDSLKRILLSEGTYHALARGDIPYYTRDLGSSCISDEENKPIDATGHKKVGRSISDEMDTRRKEDKTAIKSLFEDQGVRLVAQANDAVIERIEAQKRQ